MKSKIGKVCAKHPELKGERNASNQCRACNAEAKALWRANNPDENSRRQAAWRAENKEKISTANAEYRASHLEATKARNAEYWRKNRERLRVHRKDYNIRNADRIREANARYYAANKPQLSDINARYRRANTPKIREYQRTWYLANKPVAYAAAARRRAAKLQATPAWANEFFIQEAYSLAKLREKVCGGKWHVDHVVPLKSPLVCGLHVEHNLRVVPAAVNLAKKNYYWPDMP